MCYNWPVRYRISLIIILLCFSLSFHSCERNSQNQNMQIQYFLADRHALSYKIVREYCIKNQTETLILFDQHNDVNADSSLILSYNWVGQLLDQGILNKVYWVCSYSSNSLEINAKYKWLEKNCQKKDEERRARVLKAFEIIDYKAFQKLKIQEPYIITIDLDLYDMENQITPEDFIKESCNFLKKSKCPLVTFSLSAAYQKNPQKGWSYLECLLRNSPKNVCWYFESGDFGENAESLEDLKAFDKWKNEIETYQAYQKGFYRGAYLWLNAPPGVQDLMLEKKMKTWDSEDELSQKVLLAMGEKRLLEEKSLPYSGEQALQQIHHHALESLKNKNASIEEDFSPLDFTDLNSRGIAVRYRNVNNDRGCLALYSGVEDFEKAAEYCSLLAAKDPRYAYISDDEVDSLFINISLFSNWEEMSFYDDFIPGLDSIILVNPAASSPDKRETLLQASLASERGYSKEDFLKRLCLKAGLAPNAYLEQDFLFYKSKTISYTAKAAAY